MMSRLFVMFVVLVVLTAAFSLTTFADDHVSVDAVIPPIYGSYHSDGPIVHPQRDATYYALLLSAEATTCEQKKHPHVHNFIVSMADAYSDGDRLQVLITGHTPRLQFFDSPQHRRDNIVDGTTMSEDDILARLTAADKSAPPLGEVDLTGMTTADIARALEFWGIKPTA